MLETVEIDCAAPDGAVVWLHGLGADGHDFEPIVPELGLAPLRLRFVFPHAPVRPVTLNGGMPMRAWFDLGGPAPDRAGIADARAAVAALIEREVARGVPASRVTVAGFSQGGALALAAGLGHAAPLAAVVSLSAWLPAEFTRLDDAQRETPVFLGHGGRDAVVPVALGRQTRDALAGLGCAAEWHEYPVAHQVCGPEIADLAAFLRRAYA